MTDDMTLLKSRRRVRAQSERELRLLRLAWLAGWRTTDIAALIGESVRTVSRRLTRHGLRGPEAPGAPAGEVAAAGVQGAAYEIKSSSRGARPDAGILCPAAPHAYTGSAAGAGADVTAFGRTYRTMHSSRGPPG